MDVDDLPQARYIEQAQNAVPVRMALLALLFGRQAMNSPIYGAASDKSDLIRRK
jgi:hypothetical protein